ncbi:hypothetical protein Y1Q_0019768 [Alligator mississippiensis]|uniref:Uncharacterized protein n=1 Tax=Alligator mississippiensis TaxID=8496 RepID=A0A151PF18_ALLMI|nr:hypothetical protein Y1Q_0019768 [Alligator mississippiensis]
MSPVAGQRSGGTACHVTRWEPRGDGAFLLAEAAASSVPCTSPAPSAGHAGKGRGALKSGGSGDSGRWRRR